MIYQVGKQIEDLEEELFDEVGGVDEEQQEI